MDHDQVLDDQQKPDSHVPHFSAGLAVKNGLRELAEGVLSIFSIKRFAYQPDGSIRLGDRPSTAVERQFPISAVSTQGTTLLPTKQVRDKSRKIDVSVEFLEQVALALKCDEDSERADRLCEEAMRELRTTRRRLDYIRIITSEMASWLEDKRPTSLQACDDDEETLAHLEEQITRSHERIFDVERAIGDIDSQEIALKSRLAETIAGMKDQKESISRQFFSLLDLDQKPTLLVNDDFGVKEVFDPEYLESCQKNCDEFAEGIWETQSVGSGDYPSQPMEECDDIDDSEPAWMTDRNRAVTEDWLCAASFDGDPEQARPMIPLSPEMAEFQEVLRDVEADDSISMIGGSPTDIR